MSNEYDAEGYESGDDNGALQQLVAQHVEQALEAAGVTGLNREEVIADAKYRAQLVFSGEAADPASVERRVTEVERSLANRPGRADNPDAFDDVIDALQRAGVPVARATGTTRR